MPTLTARKSAEVPAPSHTTRAAREQQAQFDGFLRDVPADSVGELELAADENARSIKVRLRRAASRLGQTIDIWDAEGRVYFRSAAPKSRRGRPRKVIG